VKPAALWPLAVVAALVVTVGANVAILVLASDSRHLAVEPDYYRKALAWDSTQALQTESRALGWRLSADLAPAAAGALLRVVLADSTGAALPGAALRVEAIHNLDPNRRVHGLLAPVAPGVYEATLPLRHRGLWELRFDATRGADRFLVSVRRDLSVAP
jgi:nitrogen fixation protein FixH